MTDYIDRQAAIDAVMISPQKWDGMYIQDLNCRLRDALNTLPTAQPEPVKRGKWEITEAYPHNVYCSVCHKRFAQTHWAVWEDGSLPRAYCPNCGAKMEGEEA